MALRPPSHRIDAPGIYIVSDDSVWNLDRIEEDGKLIESRRESYAEQIAAREKACLEIPKGEWPPKPPEPPGLEDYPVVRYRSGETRFDIEAPMKWEGEVVRITDWWTDDPTRFFLRQLPIDVYARLADKLTTLTARDSDGVDLHWNELMLTAMRHGIERVENVGWDFQLKHGKVTDETVRKMIDIAGGWSMVFELGLAVWRYSQPVSPQEKKA